jgi:fatty-acyl-CoA synthase
VGGPKLTPDGSHSLWHPLIEPRRARPDLLNVWNGTAFTTWSWEQWYMRACQFAAGLRAAGVAPGERVAGILTNTPDACAAVLGTWFAGACFVSMPLIARGLDSARYMALLERIVKNVSAERLICDRMRRADDTLPVPVASFEAMMASQGMDPEPPADDES